MLLREVKSFVTRKGKITPGQQRALYTLMPIYGVLYAEKLIDLNMLFARNNPKVVEIGFGMGKTTSKIALDNPEIDYLGLEVHQPGVGSLLMELQEHNIDNVRLICYDAVKVIKNMIMDNSVAGFHIFFPDPWHKKRHNKRRIIQDEFVSLLCQKLKPGGYIHLATDWEDYALWMLEILNKHPQLTNQSLTKDYVIRPVGRPLTKFEERGIRLGHGVWDLIFNKSTK